MPGDDLLFHRLSDSTIGAVRFHGRVRDGIGWGTDAIATKQWGQRKALVLRVFEIDACTMLILLMNPIDRLIFVGPHESSTFMGTGSGLSLMVELSSANRAISIG